MLLNSEDALDELQDIFRGNDDRLLIAESMLGEDAAEFVKSDLGRYLIGRANQEIEDAVELLKKTASWRRNRIAQLQHNIRVAESAKEWILECIVSGKTALAALERRRTTGEE